MQRASWFMRTAAGGLLLLALVVTGCGGGSAFTPGPPAALESATSTPGFAQATAVQQALHANVAVDPAIVSADDTLGLDLLKLLNEPADTNRAISPTSIALALQMLYNGAEGTTQQAMAQALQLDGLSAAEVNQDNAALQASLVNPDPEVNLTIANSLWMHLSDNPVLPGFIQTNQTYYAAQIGDLAGAPADINEWAANATDGLITQVLPSNFNPKRTVLVIADAIYFKGAWSSAFDPKQTMSAPFQRADGTQVSCQMMHQTGAYEYLQTDDVQVIRLPYGQKHRMSMIVVLPQPGMTLDAVVNTLTTAQLGSWIAQLHPQTVAVGLPRFQTSYATSLKQPLITLGMGVAFSRTADLSAIAPRTYVSFVQHSTFVEVDETGTTAAAVTTIGVAPTVVAPTPAMTMDRPFLYAIRDDETGALVFVGLMFDPTGT